MKYDVEKKKHNIERIILIVLLMGVFAFSFSLFLKIEEKEGPLLAMFVCALIMGYFMVRIISDLSVQNFYKKIRTKGVKLPGEVLMPFEEYQAAMGGNINYVYFLLVKYIDPVTQQEVEYKTPKLGFNPYRYLASTDCTVYYLDGQVYVGDFKKAEKKEDALWHAGNVSENIGPFIRILLVFLFLMVVLWFLI